MTTKAFTEKQQLVLMNNPYVLKVTPHTVTMTYEFKKLFMKETFKQGMTSRRIFESCGIGTDLLDRKRMNDLGKRIRKEAVSEAGLKPDKGPSKEERLAAFSEKNLEKGRASDIKALQREIVELRQEVEFLKKISNLYSATLDLQALQNTTVGDDTS